SIISEDCPILPMYEPMMVVAHHKWLGNFKQHPIAIGLGTARYLRIDTKARAAAAPAGPDRKKLP
ncbi:MAG: hypothetical protein QGH60_25345, partial [Phycisphaerae bacterium]|nr:hypothetical protein [Phycisphaerae bacterium]